MSVAAYVSSVAALQATARLLTVDPSATVGPLVQSGAVKSLLGLMGVVPLASTLMDATLPAASRALTTTKRVAPGARPASVTDVTFGPAVSVGLAKFSAPATSDAYRS